MQLWHEMIELKIEIFLPILHGCILLLAPQKYLIVKAANAENIMVVAAIEL